MNPNLTRSRALRASLLAVASAAGLAVAVAATDPPPAGEHPASHQGMPGDGMRHPGMGGRGMRGEGMRGGPMEMMDPFMRALRELDLTSAQRDKVHDIMEAAHKSHEGQMKSMGENLVAIGNPGDPGYDAAVQAAKDRSAAMIQHHSDIDKQIYNELTADQKARLPKVLADMKAKLDERKAHWGEREHDRQGQPGKPAH